MHVWGCSALIELTFVVSDLNNPFHDKEAGAGISDQYMSEGNPGTSRSVEQSTGATMVPTQPLDVESCRPCKQLPGEEASSSLVVIPVNKHGACILYIDLVTLLFSHSIVSALCIPCLCKIRLKSLGESHL